MRLAAGQGVRPLPPKGSAFRFCYLRGMPLFSSLFAPKHLQAQRRVFGGSFIRAESPELKLNKEWKS
ncbi:MAG TPA: hypothetical protein DCO82_05965 [Alphaproteobacteria bacterium]|jgi:hypothetical protein|nr:hypothetical protein [Alphaproteobacteria bacterium]